MATKGCCSTFNNDISNGKFSTQDSQYRYINLNSNQKCSMKNYSQLKCISSDSRTTKDQNYDCGCKKVFDQNFDENRNKNYSWRKPNGVVLNKSDNLNIFDSKYESKKQWKNEENFTNSNNNSLSLHIAVYKNSTEALHDSGSSGNETLRKSGENSRRLLKKWQAQQLHTGLSTVIQVHLPPNSKNIFKNLQDQFEFPRQQKEGYVIDPELMQFKASQKLLNPNNNVPVRQDISTSNSDHICLFRKDDNSYICVDFFDLNLPEDDFWDLAPGGVLEVPDIGLCTFVVSGNQEFLDERIRNESLSESNVVEESPKTLPKRRKRKADDNYEDEYESSINSSSPDGVPIERVCVLLIDKVTDLSKTVHVLTEKVEKDETALKELRKELTALKGKKNSRENDQVVVDAAIVELAGTEENIVNISKKEFEDLLMVNRQELGCFPPIFPNIAERDKMISTVAPLLLDLCRAGKYGPFVTLLTSFLIDEQAFGISFLPPMILHLRTSRPGKDKRTLNSNFQNDFKYFALYFGGAALKSSVQSNWIENLREKYNVKVDNYKKSQKGYKQSEDLKPFFNVENAFETIQ